MPRAAPTSPARRRFLLLTACAACSGALPDGERGPQQTLEEPMPTTPPLSPPASTAPALPREGQLGARPAAPTAVERARVGAHALDLERGRDGLIYVPRGLRSERPAPLVVMLHGAGGHAEHGLSLMQPLAERAGAIVLAPTARRATWDVIAEGRYGPDVVYLDRALAQTFARHAVDPARLAIGGFSDGASYALSLGLTNGDLFTHVIAFSPGFMTPARQLGAPRIFVTHGARDEVLPIALCSRKLVPRLKAAGYAVEYREFDGPHTVPDELRRAALDWWLAPGA